MDVLWVFILLIIIVGSIIFARLLLFKNPIEIPESFLSFDKQIEKFVSEQVSEEHRTDVIKGML